MQQPPARIAFIVNPRSAGGTCGRRWEKLSARLHELSVPYVVRFTTRSGEGTTFTRDCLAEGYDRIVSVGGDGMHYEVVNGFFQHGAPICPGATMALLSLGTGSDLRRTLGVPPREAAWDLAVAGEANAVDVGKLTCTAQDNTESVHYFLSSVHFGIGAVVSQHVNRRTKILGGFWSYFIGLLTARAVFSAKSMRVLVDGTEFSGDYLDVIVANGRYDGGGMLMGPHACLDDGRFDVYLIGRLGLAGTVLNIPRIYRGTHANHPAVHYTRAAGIQVTSSADLWVSPDGELPGRMPARAEILPAALRLVTGDRAPLQGGQRAAAARESASGTETFPSASITRPSASGQS